MNFNKYISENPEVLDIILKQITNQKLTEYEIMRHNKILLYLNNKLSKNKKELKDYVIDSADESAEN